MRAYAAEILNSKLLVIPDCKHAPLAEKLGADSDPAVKFKQKIVKGVTPPCVKNCTLSGEVRLEAVGSELDTQTFADAGLTGSTRGSGEPPGICDANQLPTPGRRAGSFTGDTSYCLAGVSKDYSFVPRIAPLRPGI
jgi:hypothetical protein